MTNNLSYTPIWKQCDRPYMAAYLGMVFGPYIPLI